MLHLAVDKKNILPLIQEASSLLTNRRRVGRLLTFVWECSYRAVKDMCELWVSELIWPLVGRWLNQSSCGLLRLGEPRCEWLLSCLGWELSTALELGLIGSVLGQLLCSNMVVPVWHRWTNLLLFPTICLLWPRCLHCCPQRNDFSPSDLSGQQSLDLRSWPSCVYGEVVLSPQFLNMCSPGSTEQHKLHYSVYAWVLL